MATAGDSRRQASSGSRARRRVVIVDDEPAIVELLALLFEDEGFDVLRAYDGEQGLRLAREAHPDLIISDIALPRQTGIDLVKRLRDGGDRETPVILMSAARYDVPAGQCVFVAKPFDLDRMLEVAQAQLAGD